ncbi:MAG: hypothetical protein RIR12_82 [Bacteroidota bacterium]|jgi:TolA-binding protein
MKNFILLATTVTASLLATAQQTRYYADPEVAFKEAKEYFQKEQYSLAYPMLRDLRSSLRETDVVNRTVTVQEIKYYTIACGLMQNEQRAESEALEYIDLEKNNARVQMLNFHLAEFYFRNQNFAEAASRYEETNIANLSNKEIADMKFHQGYSYFTLQRFAAAKPLFNTIRGIKEDPNYIEANYYYGFLAFKDAQYKEALAAFKIVENEKAYETVVPYYIAQIYYIQGKKDESINYIQNKLNAGANTQFYDLELKQLLGHAYFEKKEYTKALPYLEDYVSRSKKVRREDLYELSYSYYQGKQFNKAIDGFKQLSGKDDSLSQHAMYLLGDAYLKTGQKTNARNAFLFCSSNSSNPEQKEISKFQYAKLSYELGYQDEAIHSLSSFLADYPQSKYNEEAKELMVDMLTNTNNYREAQAMLESLSRQTENTKKLYPRILLGRATEMINDGRLSDADEILNTILANEYSRPVRPYTHFWKGEIAYRTNRLDSAIKYYHLYKDAGSPTSGEANERNVKYNLGYCYLRKENYPVAFSFFEPLGKNPALNTYALEQDAYVRTADCYYMQRNYTQAKPIYDNVIKLSWPAEDYATFQLAMLAGVKSPKDKISMMNTMMRKFPNSSLVTDANMEVANTHMGDEQFTEAVPYLNAISKGNSNRVPEAFLKLATSYYNLNNNAEAIKNCKIVVDRYPNAAEAEDALDLVKTIYIEDGKAAEYADFMRGLGKPLSVSTEDSLTYHAAEKKYDDQDLNGALSAFNNYVQRFPNGAFFLDAQLNRADIYNGKKDFNNAFGAYSVVADNAPNKYAERAALGAARISFFEQKNYVQAEKYFQILKQYATLQENKLEAMRGLLRSQYQQKKWADGVANAKDLIASKGSSADDKALANMAIAKSYQINNQYDLSIQSFKTVILNNKSALAAEARYEIAYSLFQLGRLPDAEKAAFETINKSGSYDYWITKSYILLGDVYFTQKDYFNAKATFQSIIDNTLDAELKAEAQTKINQVADEESKSSKVGK